MCASVLLKLNIKLLYGIKVKICAILRGLKVILGFNSQMRENEFYAASVVCMKTRPYAAKG